MRARFFVPMLVSLGMAGCADSEDELQLKTEQSALTAAQRLAHATAIRDVAAANGLTNGALLGGIAISETGLVHCWRDATWACKGPNSPSCGNGPVIAGSGDGPCVNRQGGLGMFQFDAGTYEQTIARDGEDILLLEGNIAQAVEFVADRVRQDVAGVVTREQALAWINDIPMTVGDVRTEKWASILACRYNGCCNTSSLCMQRRAKYRDNAIDIYNEYGANFWRPTQTSTCEPVPAEGRIIDQREGCYTAAGSAQFWRPVENTGGYGGDLEWTMATDRATASNYAAWKIDVAQPGTYRVSVHLDGGTYGQSKKAAYQVTHQGPNGQTTSTVVVDQSAATGFFALGEFEFSGADGEQVLLGDNTGEASATMTKVLFDAISVVPAGMPEPIVPEPDDRDDDGGCSAGGGTSSGSAFAGLALFAMMRRRRR